MAINAMQDQAVALFHISDTKVAKKKNTMLGAHDTAIHLKLLTI